MDLYSLAAIARIRRLENIVDTKATGYSVMNKRDVFPETSVEFHSKDGILLADLVFADDGLYNASECTVVFDGIQYDCTKNYLDGIYYYGNSSIVGMGDNTGEPFILAFSDGNSSQMAVNSEGLHTVKISVTEKVLYKIDEELIPDARIKVIDLDDYGMAFGSSTYEDTGEFWDEVNSCNYFVLKVGHVYYTTSFFGYGTDGTEQISGFFPYFSSNGVVNSLYFYKFTKIINDDGSVDTKTELSVKTL